jgi:CRP-like cAMP-binding protein
MQHLSEEIVSQIQKCPLFSGIEMNELSQLLDKTSARIRNYGKKDLIAQAGDEVHFLHILITGSVNAEMTDYSGKVIKIEDLHPPKPLAPAFLFGAQNRYPVNITALEDAELLSIPRDEFLKVMQLSEQVLRNFVNSVSSRGQFLSNKIKFLSFSSIREKLAQYFLELSKKTGSDDFILPLSQSQLAELFGVTRPSVGRAVSEMNQDGLIRTDGKRVFLMDKAKLTRILQS